MKFSGVRRERERPFRIKTENNTQWQIAMVKPVEKSYFQLRLGMYNLKYESEVRRVAIFITFLLHKIHLHFLVHSLLLLLRHSAMFTILKSNIHFTFSDLCSARFYSNSNVNRDDSLLHNQTSFFIFFFFLFTLTLPPQFCLWWWKKWWKRQRKDSFRKLEELK